MSIRVIFALLVVSCATVDVQVVHYRSAFVDPQGRLHVVQASGVERFPPKSHGQVGFDSPAISPDGETAGWLEAFQDASPQSWRRYAGYLDLYQGGRITRRFRSDQTYYGWQFWKGGMEVISATGGEHGGATECERRDVQTGKLLERWLVQDRTPAPGWARGLAKYMREFE